MTVGASEVSSRFWISRVRIPTSTSTSQRCQFCLCSFWTGVPPSIIPCIWKWDMTHLIDHSETSPHMAIWSILRNLRVAGWPVVSWLRFCTAWHDYGTVSFCSSKKITANILLTRYFNSKSLEKYCELPSHWWLKPVKISMLFGTVSSQICWFFVKLWLTNCCDCFFVMRHSHMANLPEMDSKDNSISNLSWPGNVVVVVDYILSLIGLPSAILTWNKSNCGKGFFIRSWKGFKMPFLIWNEIESWEQLIFKIFNKIKRQFKYSAIGFQIKKTMPTHRPLVTHCFINIQHANEK